LARASAEAGFAEENRFLRGRGRGQLVQGVQMGTPFPRWSARATGAGRCTEAALGFSKEHGAVSAVDSRRGEREGSRRGSKRRWTRDVWYSAQER
jgi:hypothetical protein